MRFQRGGAEERRHGEGHNRFLLFSASPFLRASALSFFGFAAMFAQPGQPAPAQPSYSLQDGNLKPALPSALQGVGIDQKLNEQVPLGLVFHDEAGRDAPLSSFFQSNKPVILVPVYYRCPMLCTQILAGVESSLKAISLNPGRDFEVVSFSFDPKDTPETATSKKQLYLQRYGRPGTANGWHFLTGDAANIKALTDSVGFHFKYDPKTDQFAHASGIMVLTPDGHISKYFYGVDYAPRDLRLGLVEASQDKIGNPVDRILLFCYHYDPATGKYGAMAINMDQSELDVAGGIMGCPIELTEAEHVSLPIPALAEIVIEGLLHPGDVEMEGPLGEFTGYYGNERSPQPVIEIKAIHHRRAPILTAALMARYPSSEISTGFAIMKSARILDDLQRIGVPGVVAAYTTPAAICGMGIIVVSLKQLYAGHTAQVLALTAQCPAAAYYTKWVIAVDDDVDPTDFNQVLWALTTRCHPIEDFEFMKNTWSSALDPAQYPPELRSYGSKVLIDACKPHRHIQHFPQATMLRRKTYDHVVNRWQDLGFSELPPEPVAFHPE